MIELQAERDRKVVKANDLIQKTRFNLSVAQQRIILYLISQITPKDHDFQVYDFNLTDFCKVTGLDSRSGQIRKEIEDAVQGIADTSWWFTLDKGQRAGQKALMRWIDKVYLDYDTGVIGIRLDDDLKPYLLDLKQNFTQYELVWTLKFKSKYSIRLYELIKSIHFHDLSEYSRYFLVDDLQGIMGSDFSTFSNFKLRALDPAVKEINRYSDKNIRYELHKKGNKVDAVRLIVGTKDPVERVFLEDEINHSLGLNPDQLTLWEQMEDRGIVKKEWVQDGK